MSRLISILLLVALALAGLCSAEPVAEPSDVKVLLSLYQKYGNVVSKDWWWIPPDCRWYGLEWYAAPIATLIVGYMTHTFVKFKP